MTPKRLPRAQRRVLHQVARANHAGVTWWKYARYWHDFAILHKLARRGFIVRAVRRQGNGWEILDYLTPKGWASSSIPPATSSIGGA